MACLLLALLMALSVSCSKGGSEEIPIGEQELPDMVMRDATYMLSQKEDSPMVMKAATITIWGTGRDTVLENVSCRQNTSCVIPAAVPDGAALSAAVRTYPSFLIIVISVCPPRMNPSLDRPL